MIASKEEIRGEAVALHYDELDRFYREVWGEHVHHGLWLRGDESREMAVKQLALKVASEAQIGRGSRVCDIGCGYGETARLFVKEFGAQVTALTISPKQHEFASSRAGRSDNPSYLLADWMTAELPADSFDAAIAIESSEHMPDKARFFSNAHRVLRDDGRLVVCAWLSCEKPSRMQERWLLEPICREGRMPHLGTETEYRRLAADAGFQSIGFEDVSAKVERTWPMIVRLFLLKLAARPAYLKFLLNRHSQNRVFALTIVRLWLAYRTGAMRYGIFTFEK
ncbi:MAG: Methyltransferase type 11 [Chthoniobacteraceae bacterium]|nr:Methyltransferase type 11 [Chthoniobacteraceae bacterium]